MTSPHAPIRTGLRAFLHTWRWPLGLWLAVHALVAAAWLATFAVDGRAGFHCRTAAEWRLATMALPILMLLLAGRRDVAVGRFLLGADALALALLHGALLAGWQLDRLHRDRSAGDSEDHPLFGLGVSLFLVGSAVLLITALALIGLIIHRAEQGWNLLRGWRLRERLAPLGYGWLTVPQAADLWRRSGPAARCLPPWEEVATLPDVSQENMHALAEVALRAEAARRGRR